MDEYKEFKFGVQLNGRQTVPEKGVITSRDPF